MQESSDYRTLMSASSSELRIFTSRSEQLLNLKKGASCLSSFLRTFSRLLTSKSQQRNIVVYRTARMQVARPRCKEKVIMTNSPRQSERAMAAAIPRALQNFAARAWKRIRILTSCRIRLIGQASHQTPL